MFEGAYIRNHFSVSILMSLYTAEGGGERGLTFGVLQYVKAIFICCYMI